MTEHLKILLIVFITLGLFYSCNSEGAEGCTSEEEFDKLVEMVYFEARGESWHGQLAVATVAVNRTHSSKFPDTLCGVINQRKQFSYYSEGLSYEVPEGVAKEVAESVAECVLKNNCSHALVSTATFYHACDGPQEVTPYWAEKFTPVVKIKNHCFFRESN